MGGSPNLLMPVTPSYVASWLSHTHRSPKSTEPGTDMFVPIGTPIYAPADGRVYGSGNTIAPMTGRWIGLDLDNGLRFRAMHLSRLVSLPAHVKRGDLIGYSGASGYGHEDWSHLSGMPAAHTHVTLWPTHESRYGYRPDGKTPYTVDFMEYVGGSQSGGGGAAPVDKDDDDMKFVGNAQDGYKLVDELGADDWAQYAFVQGGATFGDNLAAARILAEQTDVGHGWPLDLVRHIANARWDQKRGQIVTDTVAALRPLFAEIASAVAGISPERFAELIDAGLEGVVVKVEPVSDEDKAAIAEVVREKFRNEPLT